MKSFFDNYERKFFRNINQGGGKEMEMEMETTRKMYIKEAKQRIWLGVRDIKKIIPHRWPMLLIQQACHLSTAPNVIVTIRKIGWWDIFLFGHFPGRKVYPGVLLLEIMAQSAAVLVKKKFPHLDGLPFFREVMGKFLLPVLPGDMLTTRIELIKGEKPNRPFIFSGSITNQRGEIVCKSDELKGFLEPKK